MRAAGYITLSNPRPSSRGLNPAKAAIALRKAFDAVIEAAMAAKQGLEVQRNATRGGTTSTRNSASSAGSMRGRGSRGGSAASSAPASPSGSRSPSRTASAAALMSSAAETDAADHASSIAAALSLSATAADKAEQGDSNTRVASLQRQLEALSARQREAEVAAAAAAALVGDGFSDDEDGDEEEGGGGGGAAKAKGGSSMLEVATRRCAEMEDRIDDLEGERTCSVVIFMLHQESAHSRCGRPAQTRAAKAATSDLLPVLACAPMCLSHVG